jgi:hypothetical protein
VRPGDQLFEKISYESPRFSEDFRLRLREPFVVGRWQPLSAGKRTERIIHLCQQRQVFLGKPPHCA